MLKPVKCEQMNITAPDSEVVKYMQMFLNVSIQKVEKTS
jgi:hypothetical protein